MLNLLIFLALIFFLFLFIDLNTKYFCTVTFFSKYDEASAQHTELLPELQEGNQSIDLADQKLKISA